MIKGKEQCLIPEYILKFLEKLYLGIVPEDYGQRMVSKKLLSKMKALYHFYNDKIPSNFGRLLCPEYLIDFIKKIDLIEYTDDDTAYIKEVPEGSLKYAFINACGGMSYKSENLLVLNDVAETTTNGVTYKVENGVITFSGVASANFNITLTINLSLTSGSYTHCQMQTFPSGLSSNLGVSGSAIDGSNQSLNYSRTFSIESDTTSTTMYFVFVSGTNVNGLTLRPMLVKGSTAPTEFKPYFTGIRDSAVTSVVSKDSNNTTIDTLTIPAEVQALEGYGWGINDSCFNYIDLSIKKFKQYSSRVKLKDLTFTYVDDITYPFFSANLTNSARSTNVLCNIYNYAEISTNNQNEGFMVLENSLRIRDNNYTDATSFKNHFTDNDYIYFELETPVETDITSLMPSNFGYIEVRPEGKVIFNNEYEQAVPSAITYLVEV